MSTKKTRKFCADFEATTDPEDCRVWAWALTEIGNTAYYRCGNTIAGFFEFVKMLNNCAIYFHNLKFDGEFILAHLLQNGYKHIEDKELPKNTLSTLISDKGQFYTMRVCDDMGNIVTYYDSFKILPFSVDAIAKAFGLTLQKLSIDYKGTREIGHELTQEERAYIRNDVTIVAKALEILFTQGLTKMTQGSNAMYDYKRMLGKNQFISHFPPPEYDADIRQAYKGGYTYLKHGYEDRDIGRGIVLDVNSLYPYVMHDRLLPYGEGIYFDGKYAPDELYPLYVQMLRCQFEIKPGHLPTLQIKHTLAFCPTEYLTSSNDDDVTLCLTSVDLKLFFEHYNVYNIEYFSGWKFKGSKLLFREYIDKWYKIKQESTINGNKPMRTLSKLMQNALYGKFALNPRVQSKIPYIDNGIVKYKLGKEELREPVYIPVGCFVTAWARDKTIRAAQSCYDRFVYADTDSLHLIGTEYPENLEIDPVKLGAWKHESTFNRARFIRQKSYIEEIGGKLHITCAGLPERSHQYVTWDNFHPGAQYAGKLQPTHVSGGIILKDIDFTIKR